MKDEPDRNGELAESGQRVADVIPTGRGRVQEFSRAWRPGSAVAWKRNEARPRRRQRATRAPVRRGLRPMRTLMLLAACDLAAVALATVAFVAAVPHALAAWVVAGGVVTLLGLIAYQPYGQAGRLPAAQVRRLLRVTAAAHVAIIVAALFQGASAAGAAVLALCAGMTAGLLVLARATIHELLATRPWWGWPAAVLGDDPAEAARIVRSLRLQPEVGLKPVVILRRERGGPRRIEGLRVVHGPHAVDRLQHHFGVEHVVGIAGRANGLTLMRIDVATPHFAKLTLSHRLPLIAACPSSPPRRTVSAPRGKRLLDLAATVLGMVGLVPLTVLIAALIKLDSRGPVMFKQKRPGHRGRPFRIFKFRTMRVGAARMHTQLSPELLAEFDTYGKIRRDPRITRIGRLLRRTSLDELPQLLNVIRGEMSLVGPRPHMMNQRAKLVAEHAASLEAMPGLTGLWQISGRSNITWEMRLAMDAYYARVASVELDLYILARTVAVVLRGKGAY